MEIQTTPDPQRLGSREISPRDEVHFPTSVFLLVTGVLGALRFLNKRRHEVANAETLEMTKIDQAHITPQHVFYTNGTD